MAKFDVVVADVTQRIREGRVLLSERIRAGKQRSISVGPYRTATASRQYGLCVLPALPEMDDCILHGNADRIAREFVRLVGVPEAQSALNRESRKGAHATKKSSRGSPSSGSSGMQPFDISAVTRTGTADRMLVWAPTKAEAISKFERENRGWKIVGVRAAVEIDPASYVG